MKLTRVWASIISALILLVLDAGYIYTIKNGYLAMLRKIQGSNLVEINMYAIVFCYAFVIGGLILYVLPYAQKMIDTTETNSVMNKVYVAVIVGGLFGAIVYGIYNTTNMAIFKDFSLQFALFDIVWGSFLFYISTLVYLLLRK
jgi:uncharacterized membrane protein